MADAAEAMFAIMDWKVSRCAVKEQVAQIERVLGRRNIAQPCASA
jgi:hypothetical protein